jgi:hypothetical protein
MTRIFTYLHVEAALCIWEWVDDCTQSRGDEHRQMQAYRNEHGTCAMREDCIHLAGYCLRVYDLLPQELAQSIPYDWEIIPAIVGTIDWSVSPPARMVPAHAARVVARLLKSSSAQPGGAP